MFRKLWKLPKKWIYTWQILANNWSSTSYTTYRTLIPFPQSPLWYRIFLEVIDLFDLLEEKLPPGKFNVDTQNSHSWKEIHLPNHHSWYHYVKFRGGILTWNTLIVNSWADCVWTWCCGVAIYIPYIHFRLCKIKPMWFRFNNPFSCLQPILRKMIQFAACRFFNHQPTKMLVGKKHIMNMKPSKSTKKAYPPKGDPWTFWLTVDARASRNPAFKALFCVSFFLSSRAKLNDL